MSRARQVLFLGGPLDGQITTVRDYTVPATTIEVPQGQPDAEAGPRTVYYRVHQLSLSMHHALHVGTLEAEDLFRPLPTRQAQAIQALLDRQDVRDAVQVSP